jgi:esterase/lipase superfamily enzyme
MIDSPEMGRKVHTWCFGYFGMPIVVFPSAAGFAHEWKAQGMVDVLKPLLLAGKIKLYCPESNVSQAWTKKDASLEDKMQAHKKYEQFIINTLRPFIKEDCGGVEMPLGATGCSLGAMYAANFTLKYPEVFNRAICMSGRYKATEFTQGQSNSDVYFNDPIAYVPNMQGEVLEKIQKNTHITLICGQGPYEEGCIEETILLGKLFQLKNIPSHVDIWGKQSRHDWDSMGSENILLID